MLLVLRPIQVITRYWKLTMVAIFSLSVATDIAAVPDDINVQMRIDPLEAVRYI